MNHWQLSMIIASIFLAQAVERKYALAIGATWSFAAVVGMAHAILNRT